MAVRLVRRIDDVDVTRGVERRQGAAVLSDTGLSAVRRLGGDNGAMATVLSPEM